jgi:thioesterase domain-containing protein/acyl carrier protein
LNAFALSQPPERNATAIAWGRWSETGIGASAAGRLSVERDWILSEHRFSGGDALLPGTGQMEMAIAAARAKIGSGPIELRDVVFLAPLRVTPGQPRTVDITADAIPSGYRVAIADEGTVFCSCTSTALDAARAAAPRLDVEAIARRCRARDITDPVNARQQGHFEFGPHWSSLRRIQFGEGECLATLALPDAYAQEVNAYSLHPALMDVATGAAMFLVPGYDAPGDLMLPFSYKRVTIYGALPARIYSHIRAHGTGHADVATFDLTIADANGTVVSEIEEFAVRRLAVAPVPDAAPPVTRIATRDGLVAFRRLMSAHTPAVVYVSPADIRVASASPAAQSVSGTATKDAVPDDDIERTLGAIWQRLLGLDHVGPEADFFASGGQSLMAVRLFSEIRKRFDVDLGLSTLFDAPTLGALATTIRRARTPSTVTRPAGLVTIRPGGSRPPLFLIHSIGGRVLNYRDLSQHFPPDQPVYGIESRGLYGLEPHYRIEDMAAHYVALIREVQPHGPYFLAGHSFGGLVAHEMSRQLEVLGQPVGLVGVIDTLLRETPEVLRQAGPQNAWRRRLQTLRSPNRGEYIAMVLVARYSATQRAAYRLMHRALSRVGLKPPARLASVEQANWTAFHDHVPAPGRGPVVLFRCESRSRWDHPDPHMGWDEIAGGGVEVRSIPGDHLAMMHGDPARLIAEGLAECVARVRVPVP